MHTSFAAKGTNNSFGVLTFVGWQLNVPATKNTRHIMQYVFLIFKIRERNALTVNLFSPKVFHQKIDYVHYNPIKAGLCLNADDYHLSAAKFYKMGIDDSDMPTHCDEYILCFFVPASQRVVGAPGCLPTLHTNNGSASINQQYLRRLKVN